MLGALLSFAMGATPLAAFAKTGSEGKAIGHATAPGWNRIFGNIFGASAAKAQEGDHGDNDNDGDKDGSTTRPTQIDANQALAPVISGIS